MRTAGDSKKGVDVVVVGAGVIGLAVARELLRRGARVVVIEAGEPGLEASHAAGGMLAPQSEADADDDFFRFQCASRDRFPGFAGELRAETNWDVELEQTGTLYVGFTEEDESELERRRRWQTAAGLGVERLTGDEVRALEPSLSSRVRVALRFPRDWQVENRRLMLALVESVEEHYGARLLRATRVERLRVRSGRVEGVETSRGFIAAGSAVLAAGARTSHVKLQFEDAENKSEKTNSAAHPHIAPVRGQMVCLAHAPSFKPVMRHVVYSPRGYVVPRRDGRLLTGSTTEDAGFDKVVTAAGLHSILTNMIEIAPGFAEFTVTDTWAGLRPRAADGLPVIGESQEVKKLFYATGHYRNGILLAPLTGEIVSALVSDGAGELVELPFRIEAFSPARFQRALVCSPQS